MMSLLNRTRVYDETAQLVAGSDLRVSRVNEQWRQLNLPGGDSTKHERIDKLFPESDVAACVLDVLASGVALENVVVRFPDTAEERFYRMNFRPKSGAGKPKRVVIEACEMHAWLMLDGRTGQVLQANQAAQEVFGNLGDAGQLT